MLKNAKYTKHSKVLNYAVLSGNSFCREFTYFLASFLQAKTMLLCTKNDNYKAWPRHFGTFLRFF